MAECILHGNGTSGYEITFTNNGAFQYPSEVVIPRNVSSLTTVDHGGFYEHTEIENVTFEDNTSVTSMGNNVFRGCTSLKSFAIPVNVISIPSSAFQGCTSLEDILIPSGVISIGQSAFSNCTSLSNLTWSIGSSAVNILGYAFAYCAISDTTHNNIMNRTLGNLGGAIFEHCLDLKDIIVNKTSDYIYRYCTGIETAVITDSSSNHTISTGTFEGCTSLTDVTIANTVTIINGHTFYNCSSLGNITLPDSLTTIGGQAFLNCTSMTELSLPSTITTLNFDAFQGCSSLTSVIIGTDWNCNLNVSWSPLLTQSSIVDMLENLKDLTGNTAKTLTLGNTNLSKLTGAQKLIALDKNWNLA